MRTRYLISIVLIVITILAALSRRHIRDLENVFRTYSTFHSYLQRHPDVLFRHPADLQSSQAHHVVLDKPVPQIIHQIFLSSGSHNASAAKYAPAIKRCQVLHPEWTFKLWTDDNATEFMADFYPEILPHYSGYAQNIQRANILRYALLHHFGGVYLDLDVTCLVPLDGRLSQSPDSSLTHLPFVTPGAYPAGVNNAFILSRPQHPFLTKLLSRVASRDLHWPMPYVENMLSTGCMFFSNAWISYTQGQQRRPKEDRVYILADDQRMMEPHMLRGKITTPLFEHGGASSWHGWDAAMIVTIGKHYLLFAFVLFSIGFVASSLLVLKIARRRRWSNYRKTVGSRRRSDQQSLEKQDLLEDGSEGRGNWQHPKDTV